MRAEALIVKRQIEGWNGLAQSRSWAAESRRDLSTIARRFNAGNAVAARQSPVGTAELGMTSAVPPGLVLCSRPNGVKTPYVFSHSHARHGLRKTKLRRPRRFLGSGTGVPPVVFHLFC